MSSAGADAGDGPPPYRVEGSNRFESWRQRDHPEWVELEVSLWISGLFWDPWQHPSTQSAPAGSRDEVRVAVVPNTHVGVSYMVTPRARLVTIVEIADLP